MSYPVGKPRPLPRLQLPLVVIIAAASFLAGHYSKGPPRGPAPVAPVGAGAGADSAPRVRAAALAAAARGAPLPEMGPLGEQWLRSSGLLALRPPLAPAASGNAFYTMQPFQLLSWWPRIVVYPNFLDAARCEHIITLARTKLQGSGLAWRPDEEAKDDQDMRTSEGTFLEATSDPDGVLQWLEEKIAAVTLLPVENGEAFNVLRYKHGAHYDSHMDTFDPREFGEQPSQRMATVLVYLSDVEEGGETVFLREGRHNADVVVTDYKSCSSGFKYKPRRGDAVLFHSLTTDGQIDPRSLHGGCPVTKGVKWVATKWIHSNAFRHPVDDS